ncbi:MAG: diguanylate cyclase [Burkholderiaceae bacterium]|nr:diguanylate cyclase [Burkholderiaceae bacterium]
MIEVHRFFSNLKLVNKIVLLVALLGTLAVTITIYSMDSMRTVDRDYRNLLSHDAAATLMISDALLDLSDASSLVFAVLTEQEEQKMRNVQKELDNLQSKFRTKIQTIRPLIASQSASLDDILTLETTVFQHAARIVDSAARWRGDTSLKIIHGSFEPDLRALRSRMDALRKTTVLRYQQASDRLSETTQRTILRTAIAFGVALMLVLALSTYLSITQISSPISKLTQSMHRLKDRQYHDEIVGTERQDEVGQMAKAMQLFRDTMQHADRLEKLVSIDSLTEIPNRRALDKVLEQEWSRCLRGGLPLSFCMIDIDFFKPFNDHYGHGPGDECLQRVAETLSGCLLRPGDFVARYGGEEFAAILPVTDQAGAVQFAQRLHTALAKLNYPHAYSLVADHVTISIGIATITPTVNAVPDLLSKAADEMLYAAKRAGRNTSQSTQLHIAA